MSADEIGLTVFLIKPDKRAEFDRAFPATAPAAIALSAPLDGYFIPMPARARPPVWAAQIEQILVAAPAGRLTSQSPGGLLVISRGQHRFVITFGHAWQKLKGEWLERDFGRRVALNTIADQGIVEIRTEQVFARWHLASDRAPKATTVDHFGVRFDRDLVATVEGVSADARLGTTVRGGTNLRIRVPVVGVAETLDRAVHQFASTAYRQKWPEIDNLTPVKDSGLEEELEGRLDADFAADKARQRLVLFTPTIRRDDSLAAESYVFGRLTQDPPRVPYLTVDSWINHLAKTGESPSVAGAKVTRLHLLDGAHEEINHCSVFECFGYEVSRGGETFILSSGTWYRVVEEFLTKINKAVVGMAKPTIPLPAWKPTESEGDYNKRCGAAAPFLHFDEKLIHFGGPQSKFEFCDVMHPKSRTMVFAKIVSRSSGMSHLVEQVRRTSELCFGVDPGYRSRLSGVFKKHHPKADREWLKTRPRPADFELCLVSLGRAPMDFPFFAKCALVTLVNQLIDRGHNVTVGRV